MVFPIQIKVLDRKPADVTVREWRSIRHATYRAMGEHWYAHMLPEHFKANADRVYGYRKRSEKYLKRKSREHGIHPAANTMQLTRTGLLHTAMTSRGKVIRSFPSRFTVKMPGLPYTPRKQRTAKQPFLQGEITKLLKREITVLKRIGKDTAVEAINSVRGSKTTTLK